MIEKGGTAKVKLTIGSTVSAKKKRYDEATCPEPNQVRRFALRVTPPATQPKGGEN